MERKQDCQVEEITINGDHDDDDHHQQHDAYDDYEVSDILKKEISCHSMYGLLVESHLDCLKLCLGNMDNIDNAINPTALPNLQHPKFFAADQSELDQFMEAYCMSLKKLKEEIEEPQQESMAFINLMYSQLEELHPPFSPEVEKTELR